MSRKLVNKGPKHNFKLNKLEPPKNGYRNLGKAPLSGINLVIDGGKTKELWSSVIVEQLNQNKNMVNPKLSDIFIDKYPKKGKMKSR